VCQPGGGASAVMRSQPGCRRGGAASGGEWGAPPTAILCCSQSMPSGRWHSAPTPSWWSPTSPMSMATMPAPLPTATRRQPSSPPLMTAHLVGLPVSRSASSKLCSMRKNACSSGCSMARGRSTQHMACSSVTVHGRPCRRASSACCTNMGMYQVGTAPPDRCLAGSRTHSSPAFAAAVAALALSSRCRCYCCPPLPLRVAKLPLRRVACAGSSHSRRRCSGGRR
jgi:hypothetical protein